MVHHKCYTVEVGRFEEVAYGGSKSLDALEHVITRPQPWPIGGPFPGAAYEGWQQAFGPERTIDPHRVHSQASGANPRWREVTVPIGGRVNLLQHLSPHSGNVENTIGYALSYVHASGGERITFRFTSSEGAKVWLNDEVIADHIGYRNEALSRPCRAEAALRPGSNKLLVKIAHSNEQWGFNMDAVDADGLPARLTWSGSPESVGPQ